MPSATSNIVPVEIRLCDYVDRSLEDVVRVLDAGAGWLVEDALVRALDRTGLLAVGVVEVEVAPLEWGSASSAHTDLRWTVREGAGGDGVWSGSGSLAALRVTSGAAPRTELLLTVVADAAVHDSAALAGRDLLEVLTLELA